MTLTAFGHGDLASELDSRLRAYAKETGRGRVAVGDIGIYTRRDPDTVRGADVVFISHERYSRRSSSTFLDVAPEIVVEVLSPDNRPGEVTQKVQEYLAIGVDRVWVVDARRQQVRVHRLPEQVETLGIGDTLRDEILPGFALSLSELYSA